MRVLLVSAALLVIPLHAVGNAAALPTPGFFCDASESSVGRVFPEAEQTNDFVSYDEALCGLKFLEAKYPDWIRHDVVAKSVGWDALPSGHDQFDVFVVHVTNGKSNLSLDEKTRIVFQLSIHGNEKGGREGGFRVIEDLVRNMGMAKQHPELRKHLDWMELVFVFPNPDGWTHEEAKYRSNDACYTSVTPQCKPGAKGAETQSFVRVNGHGKDLNRQWPSAGWQRTSYQAMGEPEVIGLTAYLKNLTNVKYASDIHGMLNPADGTGTNACGQGVAGTPSVNPGDPACVANAVQGAKGHFVLTLLGAGRQDPTEVVANTALAQLVKERLNGDPALAQWSSVPSVAGAWGGEYNDWGTVWDTIGYTDSGISSDWFMQDGGLDAPGVDFELAYNHITFDNYYPGAAQVVNAMHVETVRQIVRAFMDEAALDIHMSIDVKGTRSAYLENPTLVTNVGNMTVEGWPKDNPADDAYDTAHRAFRATPNDYFVDFQGKLKDGDKPGLLDALRADDITPARLAQYQNLAIGGSAAKTLAGKPGALDALKKWVEAGGNLVLTDSAMTLLPDLGVVAPGSVDVYKGYAGATNFVGKSDLAKGVLGLARQTYEPVPLGYSLQTLTAPVWYVKASAFKGDVAGYAGKGQGAATDKTMVNFGRATLGSGKVSFLGALLPDPTLENGAPYGVESYTVTYTGNQLFLNMMGWDTQFATTPTASENGYVEDAGGAPVTSAAAPGQGPQKVPGFEATLAIGAVAAALLAFRRRK